MHNGGCEICFQSMDVTATGLLVCSHDNRFHRQCLEEWLNVGSNSSCPICRSIVPRPWEMTIIMALKNVNSIESFMMSLNHHNVDLYDIYKIPCASLLQTMIDTLQRVGQRRFLYWLAALFALGDKENEQVIAQSGLCLEMLNNLPDPSCAKLVVSLAFSPMCAKTLLDNGAFGRTLELMYESTDPDATLYGIQILNGFLVTGHPSTNHGQVVDALLSSLQRYRHRTNITNMCWDTLREMSGDYYSEALVDVVIEHLSSNHRDQDSITAILAMICEKASQVFLQVLVDHGIEAPLIAIARNFTPSDWPQMILLDEVITLLEDRTNFEGSILFEEVQLNESHYAILRRVMTSRTSRMKTCSIHDGRIDEWMMPFDIPIEVTC